MIYVYIIGYIITIRTLIGKMYSELKFYLESQMRVMRIKEDKSESLRLLLILCEVRVL